MLLAAALLITAIVVTPTTGGRHDAFAVTIKSRHTTGVVGQSRRQYVAQAEAVRPHAGCVIEADRVFPDRPTGTRMRAVLDPARGKGGELGWCRGRFRGRVIYSEAFACPDKGVCHVPAGFPTRKRVVARFAFRVR